MMVKVVDSILWVALFRTSAREGLLSRTVEQNESQDRAEGFPEREVSRPSKSQRSVGPSPEFSGASVPGSGPRALVISRGETSLLFGKLFSSVLLIRSILFVKARRSLASGKGLETEERGFRSERRSGVGFSMMRLIMSSAMISARTPEFSKIFRRSEISERLPER